MVFVGVGEELGVGAETGDGDGDIPGLLVPEKI